MTFNIDLERTEQPPSASSRVHATSKTYPNKRSRRAVFMKLGGGRLGLGSPLCIRAWYFDSGPGTDKSWCGNCELVGEGRGDGHFREWRAAALGLNDDFGLGPIRCWRWHGWLAVVRRESVGTEIHGVSEVRDDWVDEESPSCLYKRYNAARR